MSKYSDLLNTTCIFCGKKVQSEYFPGECDCAKAKAEKEAWLEEYRASPDYVEPLTDEEYEEQYPVIFKEQAELPDTAILTLEVREEKKSGKKHCCIVRSLTEKDRKDLACDDDDDDYDTMFGHCFDLNEEDLNVLYYLMNGLRISLKS